MLPQIEQSRAESATCASACASGAITARACAAVQHRAPGRPRPKARQPRHQVDQPVDVARGVGHRLRTAVSCRAAGPGLRSAWPSPCVAARAGACASLIAARIRSSTTSFSDGTKIDGSMSSPVSSPLAVAVRVHQPGAGFAGDDGAAKFFLQLGHLRLHLLRGLHHLGHVAKTAQTFQHPVVLSIVLERIPFVVHLGQRLERGSGGQRLGRADFGDLRAGKGRPAPPAPAGSASPRPRRRSGPGRGPRQSSARRRTRRRPTPPSARRSSPAGAAPAATARSGAASGAGSNSIRPGE